MLFGQSVFQSVLTRLKEEHEDGQGEDEAGFRITGLGAGFVAALKDAPEARMGDTDAYFDFMPDAEETVAEDPRPVEQAPAPPPPAPTPPPHLLRLSEKEIAEELAITTEDTEATLGEKRRRFAKANHPDGVPPEFRENANTRMTIANQLIDAAIRRTFWR